MTPAVGTGIMFAGTRSNGPFRMIDLDLQLGSPEETGDWMDDVAEHGLALRGLAEHVLASGGGGHGHWRLILLGLLIVIVVIVAVCIVYLMRSRRNRRDGDGRGQA
jgi:hypothetical protein